MRLGFWVDLDIDMGLEVRIWALGQEFEAGGLNLSHKVRIWARI